MWSVDERTKIGWWLYRSQDRRDDELSSYLIAVENGELIAKADKD